MANKQNSIQLLDLKIGKKVTIYSYLKDFFNKPRYFKLPENIIIQNIIIFIFSKLRKFILFCQLIIKSKFIFCDPPTRKNVLFDDEQSNISEKIFVKKNYFILKCRIEKINEIYISRKIIFYILKNFFKSSLKVNYISALIFTIKPKNIVTIIDNSIDFFLQARVYQNKKINFIAIQNAHRYDNDAEINKLRFLTKYFTFSKFERKIIKNKNIRKNIIPLGSVRSILAKKYLNNKIRSNRMYDICLISEPDFEVGGNDLNTKNIDKKIALVADHCLTFSKKFKKKIIFSGKYDIKSNYKLIEKKFYSHNLRNKKFKISFNNKKNFSTYKNIVQSEVIVGCSSSLLRESFAFKKKVLWCNFLKETKFPFNGPMCLNNSEYASFEKSMIKIINMNYKTYFKKLKNSDNIYYNKNEAFDNLKKSLL